MGNCGVQVVEGEEQKLGMGQLGNDAHDEIKDTNRRSPLVRIQESTIDSNGCCISEVIASAAGHTVDTKAVGCGCLKLESDVTCGDSPPWRGIENGGCSMDWRTYMEV